MFLKRTEETLPRKARQPEKNWKFSQADVKERQHWDEYMEAYEDMIRNTAQKMHPGLLSRPITNGLPAQ